MNGPFQVAQVSGTTNSNSGAPPRIFKLAKPLGDQAVVVNLGYDQKVQVDFTSIANEKITLVRVGDKLIILFDNKSTVTVEPFFDLRHDALKNLTVEVAPGRDVSLSEFASLFPITTDQSVLPAAGEGNGNAQGSGANFSSSSVDPLNSGNPLDLLGQEELGNFDFSFATAAQLVDVVPTALGNAALAFDEDGLNGGNLGGIGDLNLGSNGPISATGTLAHSYDSDGVGTTLFLGTGAPAGFTYTLNADRTILTVSQMQNGSSVDVIRITLSNTTDGIYNVTQLRAINHASSGDENDQTFIFNYQVTDSDGETADGSLTLTVDDDTPVAVANPEGVHGAVAEDGMSAALGDHSTGNLDAGQTTASDETSGGIGSLTGLFAAGADAPLTFGLNSDTSGLPVLFSHGEQLAYSVAGNVLTASTSFGTVFTLQVNANGSWSFDLQDQLDHVPANGDSGTQLRSSGEGGVSSIDFSSVIVATDADGDSAPGAASGAFTISVQNDVPIIPGESKRCSRPIRP